MLHGAAVLWKLNAFLLCRYTYLGYGYPSISMMHTAYNACLSERRVLVHSLLVMPASMKYLLFYTLELESIYDAGTCGLGSMNFGTSQKCAQRTFV